MCILLPFRALAIVDRHSGWILQADQIRWLVFFINHFYTYIFLKIYSFLSGGFFFIINFSYSFGKKHVLYWQISLKLLYIFQYTMKMKLYFFLYFSFLSVSVFDWILKSQVESITSGWWWDGGCLVCWMVSVDKYICFLQKKNIYFFLVSDWTQSR